METTKEILTIWLNKHDIDTCIVVKEHSHLRPQDDNSINGNKWFKHSVKYSAGIYVGSKEADNVFYNNDHENIIEFILRVLQTISEVYKIKIKDMSWM